MNHRVTSIFAALTLGVASPALAILGYIDPPNSGWEQLRWGSTPADAAQALGMTVTNLTIEQTPLPRNDEVFVPSAAYSLDYKWRGMPVRAALLFRQDRRLWKIELTPRDTTSCAQLERRVVETKREIGATPEGRSTLVRERMRAFRGSEITYDPGNANDVGCKVSIASNRELSRGF